MSAAEESDGGRATVVGIGASAGGVEALTALVRELPADLPAALFVVLHVSPAGTSVLAQILDRAGPLAAVAATDGMPVEAGRIHVAPPDRHLLVEDGRIRLSAGPRENGHRPAIDPTFRTLAAHGAHAVGVVLSGTRDDGTQGLAGIKAVGGTALVQSPEEAAYPGMIESALRNVAVDAVLPVAGIASRLIALSRPRKAMTEEPSTRNPDPARPDEESSTRYTCPECGGHLEREQNGDLVRYRCQVGHQYAPESLDGEQALVVEKALWTAIRLLGDRAVLLGEIAGQAAGRGQAGIAAGFRQRADEAQRAGDAVRRLVESGHAATAAGGGEDAP